MPVVAVAVERPAAVVSQEEVPVDGVVLSAAPGAVPLADAVADAVVAAVSRAAAAVVASAAVEEEVIKHDRTKLSARHNGRRHHTSFYWYWRERIDTLIIYGVWCLEVAYGKSSLPTNAITAGRGDLACMYIEISILDVAKSSGDCTRQFMHVSVNCDLNRSCFVSSCAAHRRKQSH